MLRVLEQGAKMSVTLPSITAGVHPPLRILVADDNEMLRAAVRGLLERLGHSVDVATDGREAVESAAREHFDIVFLDLQMPRMDGREAAARLREEHGGACPWIVGLSGDAEDSEYLAALGMDDFVAKPARLRDFRRILERLGDK